MSDARNWKFEIAAAVLLLTWLALPAKAELVYENEIPATAPAPAAPAPVQAQVQAMGAAHVDPRLEERATLRQALSSSQRAQETVQAQAPQTAQVIVQQQPAQVTQVSQMPQIQVGPARAYAAAETDETQNLSQSEMLRRERVREEVKNEDLLQARLEELRLRDEKRRHDEIFANIDGKAQAGTAAPAAVQEQVVVAPVTDHPGVQTGALAVVAAPVAAPAGVSQGMTSMPDLGNDISKIIVQPRAGLGQFRSDDPSYNISGRFSTGISLGVVASDNLTFEAGYQYSEYGVSLNTYGSVYNTYTPMYSPYGYNYNYETVALKQNVFEAGLKLHLVGVDARLRPFIGGGGAYSIGYINYDQAILDAYNRDPNMRPYASDYEVDAFEGYLTAGLDVRLSRNVMIGGMARYYQVLTAREKNQLNNTLLYGYSPYVDPNKQYVGGSLARASFYSVLAGVTFTF